MMGWTDAMWMNMFGTTEFLHLHMDFWALNVIVGAITLLMNIVFWGMAIMKPKVRNSK